ncbi:hypothetical protein COLO4_21092 [Corchorus olitorius]|uniref:Uncharacterized protein n=1 Tax=Corchorus olitorius TaxID=93759 RepID=A0A1R3IVA2_9ROSI|nr:hypothetical protein COLO4_21092 [Corchorus olitorius]
MATMIGMALGMLLARITTENPLAIWISFFSLTMFHMYEKRDINISFKAITIVITAVSISLEKNQKLMGDNSSGRAADNLPMTDSDMKLVVNGALGM